MFAGQKTYNGVAILIKQGTAHKPLDVQVNLPNFADEQKRVLALTLDGLRVISVYVPNGQAVGTEKYDNKLKWLAALREWLRDEPSRHDRLLIAGDFNVAPEPRDVYDPWRGRDRCSSPSPSARRSGACSTLDGRMPFASSSSPIEATRGGTTRQLAFRRKRGLRIDHILLSPALAQACAACSIDIEPRRREQPSDHAPVLATVR